MAQIQAMLRFGRSESGAAAAEMVLWLSVLILPIINAVDLGFYTYQRMQVDTAAHAAVNAAWHDCNPTATPAAPPPAITTCKGVVTGVITNMQAAAQSTSLGTAVKLPATAIAEGYYCADSAGALTLKNSLGTAASPTPVSNPTNCTGGTPPSDYIQATVTYEYKPIFSTASILSLLGGRTDGTVTVTREAWMRLDK